MQLDYIANINEYGDNAVRLYDFDMKQAILFKNEIERSILTNRKSLDLSTLDFIELRNCKLVLRIADEDLGIERAGRTKFYCDLTIDGYKKMVSLIDPFCKRETSGYQWLYDVDTQTDLLFAPAGSW